MTPSFDCIVVGAGIVGSACALAMIKRGMSVALVDWLDAGMGATAAGMGHIVKMDDSPAQLLLTQYSQSLWHHLGKQLPADCEYQQVGTLWVAIDEEEMIEVFRKCTLYEEHGVETKVLNASETLALEPNLRSDIAGALVAPSDAVVYAPAVARFLEECFMRTGGTRIHGRVALMEHGRVYLENGDCLQSRRILNAAGESAGALTSGLPVKPRKGHLAITDRYPRMVHHQIVELGYLKSAHNSEGDSIAFNVQPRSTGQILIGSSRQYGVESDSVDHHILSRMLERAASYIPRLTETSIIRIWTGFRAATPDNLPLIGPWTADETIFLATGHEGLGITTSLGTAEILAACLTGQNPAIPLKPYLPSRMSVEA